MKKLFIITVCLSAFFFTACNKELSDNFTTYTNNPLNDTVWLKAIPSTASVHDLFNLLVPGGILVDSFNTANGGTVKFGDSVAITFTAGSCIGAGTSGTPSGNSRVEVIPVKTKGDFIRFFKPTTTANGSILETGGGLFIHVSKDSKDLTLAPGTSVKAHFNDVDSIKSSMQNFFGIEGNPPPISGIDTAFTWMRDTDTSYLTTWTKPSTLPSMPAYQGYEINSKSLRWIAAERYIDSTQPKIKVTAILSPNYTNKNTAVFAVFTNMKTVVNLHPDYPSRSFFANNIPIGSSIKLISLSKIGDDLYLGVETVTSVSRVTSYTIKPAKTALKDILTFLTSL
jgi:hypothetical protein